MNSLKELKDTFSQELFNMTTSDAIAKGICVFCGNPALPRCYSEAGRKEFYISGLCEKCFDDLFMEEELEIEEDEEEEEGD